MITALHTLVYAEDPEAACAFFRDVLRLPGVDTGEGWLIFRTGPSELAVHPASWEGVGGGSQRTEQSFDLSLMCDDLAATMVDLRDRGAAFAGDIEEQSWGSTARLVVPGVGTMLLYEPKYRPPALEEQAEDGTSGERAES